MPLQRAPLILLFLLSALCVQTAFAQTKIGQILFVHGNARIISTDGSSHDAKAGMIVSLGDKIITQAASSLQIQLSDTTYFAVRPNSEVVLDQYQYLNKPGDKVETSVLRGGLRSITGTVGERNKRAFRLKTPVATIGIRGTDLNIYYIPPDRTEEYSSPTGTYLTLQRGGAYLENTTGKQTVTPGKAAYTPNEAITPEPLALLPPVFKEPVYEQELPGINDQPPVASPPPVQNAGYFSGRFLLAAGRSGHFMHHNANLLPEADALLLQGVQDTPYDASGRQIRGYLQLNTQYRPNAKANLKAGIGLQNNSLSTDFTGAGDDTSLSLSGLNTYLAADLFPSDTVSLHAKLEWRDHLDSGSDFYQEADLYRRSKAREADPQDAALIPASAPGDKLSRLQLGADVALNSRITLFGRLNQTQSQWHNFYANRPDNQSANLESILRNNGNTPELLAYDAGMHSRIMQTGVRARSDVQPVEITGSVLFGSFRMDDDPSQEFSGSLKGIQSRALWRATNRLTPFADISLLRLEGDGRHSLYDEPLEPENGSAFSVDTQLLNTTLGARYQWQHNIQLQALLQHLTRTTDSSDASTHNRHSLATELQLQVSF